MNNNRILLLYAASLIGIAAFYFLIYWMADKWMYQ